MYKQLIYIFCGLILSNISVAQDIDPNGYNVFYYPNGTKSSEGILRDGKPDHYWTSYYENGNIKSYGKRANFELDSTWVFYYQNSEIKSITNYKNGKKSGFSFTYNKHPNKDSLSYLETKELHIKNKREGESFYFYRNGKTQYVYYYQNDLKHGSGKEFSLDSVIISLFKYYKGHLIEHTRINRYNPADQKTGKWITYYDNEQIHTIQSFYKGKLNGYVKEYDRYGKLISNKRFINGEEITKKKEEKLLSKADVRETFWDNNKIKSSGAFLNNKPIGQHREYNENGELSIIKEFDDYGVLLASGKHNDKSERIGEWKEYFEDGEVYSKGNYKAGKKEGKWEYYFRNGEIEQIGIYKKDKPDKEWIWFFPNGDTLRVENYFSGKREGIFYEYNDTANLVAKGEFFDNATQGVWYYNVGDHIEIGEYEFGGKKGEWKHYYLDEKLSFVGKFQDNSPVGRHIYYWENGNIKEYGKYRGGLKHKKWKKFNPDGSLIVVYTYRDGEIIAVDGKKLPKDDKTQNYE